MTNESCPYLDHKEQCLAQRKRLPKQWGIPWAANVCESCKIGKERAREEAAARPPNICPECWENTYQDSGREDARHVCRRCAAVENRERETGLILIANFKAFERQSLSDDPRGRKAPNRFPGKPGRRATENCRNGHPFAAYGKINKSNGRRYCGQCVRDRKKRRYEERRAEAV